MAVVAESAAAAAVMAQVESRQLGVRDGGCGGSGGMKAAWGS